MGICQCEMQIGFAMKIYGKVPPSQLRVIWAKSFGLRQKKVWKLKSIGRMQTLQLPKGLGIHFPMNKNQGFCYVGAMSVGHMGKSQKNWKEPLALHLLPCINPNFLLLNQWNALVMAKKHISVTTKNKPACGCNNALDLDLFRMPSGITIMR